MKCLAKGIVFFFVLPETRYEYGLKRYPKIDGEGYMHAPGGPGLGVEIDWDYIENHTTFAG